MKLNKSSVDKECTTLEGKTTFYFDDELKGFGLKVTPKSKIYLVQAWVKGKKVRVTLGKHGALTAEQARNMAKEHLGRMAGPTGVNPNEEKRKRENLAITLEQLYEQFQQARLADGGLKPKTRQVYDSALRRCFEDWMDRPASDITKDMVVARFRELAMHEGPRSKPGGAKAQASQAMRVLRTVLNFGGITYEDSEGKSLLPENPVKRLSAIHRGWSRIDARNEIIELDDLAGWYQGVVAMKADPRFAKHGETLADYMLLCLFTGLRRGAASKLKWQHVNLKSKTFTVPAEDDKTGKEFKLPMSTLVYDLLKRRHSGRKLTNVYVFPGDEPGECIQEPKRAIAKVVSVSGVKFSMHTLRRTFATTAERLDISYYKVKQLLNYAVSGDVTRNHYIRVDVEQLRQPMQQITDYLAAQARIPGSISKVAPVIAVQTTNGS